jgi:uncharacterized protein YkwD
VLITLTLVALVVAPAPASAEGARAAYSTQAGPRARPKYSPQAAVKNALNKDRVANRRAALRSQSAAQAKAQAWANRLAREGRMYHSNLRDGINVKWCSLGENVGYGPSVQSIENAYMKSPSHRANILNTKWNGVGVGYATRGNRVYTVHVFIKTC